MGGAGIVFTEAAAVEPRGRISPEDLGLFHFVDTPAEAMALLQARLPFDSDQTTPAFARSRTPGDAAPS